MLVSKEKEKPKQGRIQRGFVKGGGILECGVLPVHFQTKLSVEIVFLVQLTLPTKRRRISGRRVSPSGNTSALRRLQITRRNVKIVLQLPQNVARARARAIWLVFEKFTSADLSQIAREKSLTSQFWG